MASHFKLIPFLFIFWFTNQSLGFDLDSGEWTHENDTARSNVLFQNFWGGVNDHEYITMVNSENFESFTGGNEESLIMFYANWCKASAMVKEEFAKVALEMAYTEGHTHLRFGAFDCHATAANKKLCKQTFNVTKYPRFLLFKKSTYSKMYNPKCPRLADFFYAWIVANGDENYCSGNVRVASVSDKRSSNPLNLLFAVFTGYWRTVLA